MSGEPAAASSRAAAAPGVVVIGLDSITGLQTSRILARRGLHVVGIAADGHHPACRTNTCRRLIVAPTDGDGLLTALLELSRTDAGAVLVPCSDSSVRTVAEAAEQLTDYRMVLPSADVVSALMDKRRFAELVDEHGLPAPRSLVVTDDPTARVAAEELTFPCVVKPALKSPQWMGAGPKVRRYPDSASWLAAAPQLLALSPELVVQEWIPGGDDCLYSCNVYVARSGIPIVTFVARKLRQWPPYLGTSSLGEAVNDDRIRELALHVLSTVPFMGLGYVEIKRDPRDGSDYIIEVNVGRPTGRSAIAEGGGVELLYTMYRDAIEAPLPADRRQHDRPVKWVHLLRDLRSALYYLRRGELTPLGWMRSLRGPKVYADLSLSDPVPFVAALWRPVTGRRQRRPVSPRTQQGARTRTRT